MRFSRALAAVLLLTAASSSASAQQPIQIVHPIYAQLPDAAENDALKREFTAAAGHYRLQPVEVIDVPGPPPSRAGDQIKAGAAKALKIAFPEALKDLDAAAAEVTTTGGAGLSTAELSDLYLYRAMATARADWNAPAALPPPGTPRPADDPRGRAMEDYLRAATLTPDRALNPRELPPQVIEDFRRAVEEVKKRPRGTLLVRGSVDAQVSLDGARPLPVAGGVTFRDLVYGEHLVHVQEIGRAAWGTALPLAAPSLELEIPERAALVLDDATAATHARRMGAKFALVAMPRPGPGARIELLLIDIMGVRHDSALVAGAAERGTMDAAVMRLDEEARRIDQMGLAPADTGPVASPSPQAAALPPPVLLSPPPASKARFQDDPAAWARDHWPLLTAAGVVVASALILSIAVAANR